MMSEHRVRIERCRGDAETFHGRELPEEPGRHLWWFDVEHPAVVLGSTQTLGVIDQEACERAGLTVVRRRSGGGAVLLWPREVLWLDIVIGRQDPRWDDDVARAMWWVGEAWIDAITEVAGTAVALDLHRGPLVGRDEGRVACFAGLGPGEVVIDGRKLVGISQRRSRGVARFQCAMYRSWRPERLLGVLADPGLVAASLSEVADWTAIGRDECLEDLVDALNRRLSG